MNKINNQDYIDLNLKFEDIHKNNKDKINNFMSQYFVMYNISEIQKQDGGYTSNYRSIYKQKYIKYKQKYLNLKNSMINK
jgi:hypothetical protein